MRVYSSFKEIARDLRLLKLQQQIDEEQLKLNLHHVQDSLSPINVVASTIGSIAKKALVLKIVNKLVGLRGQK